MRCRCLLLIAATYGRPLLERNIVVVFRVIFEPRGLLVKQRHCCFCRCPRLISASWPAMGRTSKSLVQKLLRAADSELFEMPKGWHVFSRYRTAELFLKHPAPPAVKFNDVSLYKQLSKECPQVKLQPMRLNSLQPSLSKQFVEQQMAAMQQHPQHQQLSAPNEPLQRKVPRSIRQQAFEQVQEKMGVTLQKAGHENATSGYLEFIQEQEEEALQAALRKLQEQQAAAAAVGNSKGSKLG